MNEQTFNPQYEERIVSILHEIKKELGIPSSKTVARIISRIFTTIRKSLSTDELGNLLRKLPGILQLQLIKDWRQDEQKLNLHHLDELVIAIYEEECRSDHPIFRSELDALTAVIVILKKLDKRIGLLNFSEFKFSLVREIREVIIEDYVASQMQSNALS